jgi:hypothetical protein
MADESFPGFAGPPQPEEKLDWIHKAVGKTVAAVELGELAHPFPSRAHSSEALVLHFTDGTTLSITIGSNVENLSERHKNLAPSELHTDLIPMWVDRAASR